jgi:protein-tyrosine-phosphatase
MTPPPIRVMFVCTGNICRSTMAEHYLRHLCAKRGLSVETASCGVAAEPYYEVPSPVKLLLSGQGVAPFVHKPRLATREVLKWADLIFVMTEAHLDFIAEKFPELLSRTRLLRDAAGFGEQDVEDPMGKPPEVYRSSFESIREALERLLQTDFR